ncbi:N-acetylmuramoyl-L-alanine amidase [Streptomyces violaceus]|uniref:N-acetylmuramoyl-L-alanine amidase n=1 Tax=Streptomyces violaceus TaxID=1936 RepID=A0ABZ1NLE9_STRVL|nr:N-acetylmuramoyl-L-alanine amidase [Streptomyces violaceus]
MAWYPGAIKMELQPESDSQAAIRPTQFIVHSIVAPWTARRTYEYWRDSTNLESHFGIDYEGTVGQYIGTETRADANAGANRRPDGTGAVSAETASNTAATDPWNSKQIEDLIAIGVWLHQRHGIPLRICRSHSDPGFGYHSMFPQWSTSGTACPGKARIKQFKEVVFPGIVARATGKTTTPEEDDMPTAAEIAEAVVNKLIAGGGVLENGDVHRIWYADKIPAARPPYNNPDYFGPDGKTVANDTWTAKYAVQTTVEGVRETLARVKNLEGSVGAIDMTDADIATLASAIAASPALAEQIAEKVAVKLAERLAE